MLVRYAVSDIVLVSFVVSQPSAVGELRSSVCQSVTISGCIVFFLHSAYQVVFCAETMFIPRLFCGLRLYYPTPFLNKLHFLPQDIFVIHLFVVSLQR